MYRLFGFVLVSGLCLIGCSKNAEVDSWHTPTLVIKKSDTQEDIVVTSKTKLDLNSKDEFYFRVGEHEQDKSIQNLRVSSTCSSSADFSKETYDEEHDLGSTRNFRAHDLLPPTALFENVKEIFCQWTLTIYNSVGSSRRYVLQPMRLINTALEPNIVVSDRNQNILPAGSRINSTNVNTLVYSTPEIGGYSSRFICDLLTTKPIAQQNSVAALVTAESDHEDVRFSHPTQRCFVEVKYANGHIYRSLGYQVFLHPEPLATAIMDYQFVEGDKNRSTPIGEPFAVANIRLKNQTDRSIFVTIFGPTIPFDILFFDDRMNGRGELENAHIFYFERKSDGQLEFEGIPSDRIVKGRNESVIQLQPHEELDFTSRFSYSVRCGGGGEFSLGGIRLPPLSNFLSEGSSYHDKKDISIMSVTPLKYILINTPQGTDDFIKLLHNKLFYPKSYQRQFSEVKRGC